MSEMVSLLGLNTPVTDLTPWQGATRAFIVYILSLAIVRIGRNRLLGRSTSLDIILGIMLGSILSRGINGAAPMGSSLAAGFVLVVLHRLIAELTFRIPILSFLINGRSVSIIENGRIEMENLKRNSISERDLEEEMRLNGNVANPNEIRSARLERNGEISVVRNLPAPRIIEVKVTEGVQTVRLEIV